MCTSVAHGWRAQLRMLRTASWRFPLQKKEQKIDFNEGINAYERAVSLVVCDDVSGVL